MKRQYPKIECDDEGCKYQKAGHCTGFVVDDARCPNLTPEEITEFYGGEDEAST